ncbi:DoxX-like family protein [Rufibacter roseus]|uniref:DoxX-like family protein n=1 Tax=Rufibacter roseus TaxID=1567108 RepID=A0ABW2DKA7_9BACT|nr:DoxX-like family protein [Rufibacter roseus]
MANREIYRILTYFLAVIWFVNGLFCKVLNLVSRHEQIVARILGDDFSRPLTVLIGLAEVGMTVWILSGIKSRLNALVQIAVVATMNILEVVLVPDLLLWGRLNAFFALLFILVVYYKEFELNKELTQQA